MKKAILIVCALAVSSCTFTRQQKAESLVKSYLNEHLNDPHSYESVSFLNVDTVFKKYEVSDPEGIGYYKNYEDVKLKEYTDEDLMDKELKKDDMNWKNYNRWERESKILTVQVKKWEDFFEAKNKGYKGPIQCFKIFHTYRAKNGFGALGLETSEFTIDSAFTKVTYADQIKM